jgi:diaminopimelate decarboxylase
MTRHPLAPDWLTKPGNANDLAPGLWSDSVVRNEAGVLCVGGVSATDLVRDFGSPLYVIDEATARERATHIRDVFTKAFAAIGTDVSVYYASKAFLSTEVARWMVAAGLRIDVASGGELAVALAAGVPGDRIGLHGNNKSVAEIERAVAARVGTIVVDSAQEVERVAAAAAAAGVVQRVRLRVNSGVLAHTHEFLATAHGDQKFGISIAAAPAIVEAIRAHASLEFVGLHCHIGSQIFDAGGFSESARRLLGLHADLLAGGPVAELNLGGGFGIAYTSVDRPTEIAVIAAEMARVVGETCRDLGIAVPHICIEPGRAVIGTAGLTLYTVGTTKSVTVDVPHGTAERLYVSVDGGMSDNARPALYGADYAVRIASRESAADPVLVRVAGKHCESGDILVNADYLPGDVAVDDVLAVPATGAYCFSLASNYNYLARPAVVAVMDGQARVIVRGETENDLLARDAGIERTPA